MTGKVRKWVTFQGKVGKLILAKMYDFNTSFHIKKVGYSELFLANKMISHKMAVMISHKMAVNKSGKMAVNKSGKSMEFHSGKGGGTLSCLCNVADFRMI